jgi:hypothetical protein
MRLNRPEDSLRTASSRCFPWLEVVVRDRIELSTFRFSGECPGPRESTAGHLSRPGDLFRHLGVQDRPYVSTTVVSRALATGIPAR